jgi:hypothetical protein
MTNRPTTHRTGSAKQGIARLTRKRRISDFDKNNDLAVAVDNSHAIVTRAIIPEELPPVGRNRRRGGVRDLAKKTACVAKRRKAAFDRLEPVAPSVGIVGDQICAGQPEHRVFP